jgi:alpha-beta hydrolase superfamily lysophospholipase
VDTRVYDGDPGTDRQLKFDAVHVDSELGPLPAWYVPPTTAAASSTWIIAVHGRQGTIQEPLRVLPTLAAGGHPTLVTSYRNDPDSPRSPDGYYHLGDTEWRDVQAAIEYARSHGATGVVLYGWSMGGTLTLTALRRMPAADVAFVHAVVLDSPAIDWTSVLDLQGGERGLPLFETRVAERIAEVRDHMSLAGLDARPYAPQLAVPMLIFVDTSDTTVPVAPTLEFAAAAPAALVTLVKTSGGDHTGSWNVNPSGYEAQVTSFLSRVAQGTS